MTKYQKETLKYSLEQEKKILNTLKKDYEEAEKTIEARIKKLMVREDADLPHVIHQVNYQKALRSQIDDVLDKLNDGTYSSIQKYMEDSYGTGFTSSLYRLQKQGVPLIFPMDRSEILRAVQTNSKISKKKYGKNFTKMKNTIRNEVTRGISSSMSFGDIARNIDNRMKVGLNSSYRVARTEGHRINQEASFDVMHKAKEAGADVVKKWDSTLDSRTRPHHSQLDGQIKELDEPFEVAGLQAMYPSGFGKAEEDINCRCVVLEVGRWELDEDDTYSKFNGESGVLVSDLSNIKNYSEFRKMIHDIDWDSVTNDSFNEKLILSKEYESKFDGYDEKQKQTIISESRRILLENKGTNYESYSVIAPDGEIVYAKSKIGIRGGNVDYKKFQNYKDLILIHNHPSSRSFSINDLSLMLSSPNIKEMIACGHDGTVYSISFEDNFLENNSNFIEIYKYVFNIYNEDVPRWKKDSHETLMQLQNSFEGFKYVKR